ncbi:hypothetical protein [Streptomyces carpaticus]|uniref:hypothetical protein n=1 Tax=Streptomyces carpaticus TaxID=285558 RepID=UPI0031F8DD35
MERALDSHTSGTEDARPTELTLIVETALGLFARKVPAALPLPAGVDPGIGAEMAAHQAAATWGLPDFVLRPVVRRVGSRQRELGDCLLLSGKRGAVVQIKSRQGRYKDDAGERSWLHSRSRKAARQAKGTVRNLHSSPAEFANGRDRPVSIHGQNHEWIGVIVLDHERIPPETVVDCSDSGLLSVALIRRDWDFLFHQLRSTTAVLDYLFRVADLPAIALGEEPRRYYELASADAAAPPGTMDGSLIGGAAEPISVPLLPQAPTGWENVGAHLAMRIVMEDLATMPFTTMSEAERLMILADVDRLPVAVRAEWGQLLLDMLDDVGLVPDDEVKWRFRRFINDMGTRHLIFGCASRFDPDIGYGFQTYTELRHHELSERSGKGPETSTVGVLLTPRSDGRQSWDTSTVRMEGNLSLTSEQLEFYRELWPR